MKMVYSLVIRQAQWNITLQTHTNIILKSLILCYPHNYRWETFQFMASRLSNSQGHIEAVNWRWWWWNVTYSLCPVPESNSGRINLFILFRKVQPPSSEIAPGPGLPLMSRVLHWGRKTHNTCYLFIQSGDDDYLMNETRRKPSTRTRCPTLFEKWVAVRI